ncbi:prepilin peptidase [Nesterenkonia xinjiangensis]|uniref:Leader peptidase (Prepilin peptidase)/N-methyltransferase n=1 Tax=Nesterenkonia xinjiangensis TaxID=225327 RepID=A0A7Z0GKG2_9MICC|nr:leader peptidase (prepilin peptidase)/N-methyltransferase [Nesterenkonia xinjiangensis]
MIPFIGDLITSGAAAEVLAGMVLLLGGMVFAVCAIALSFIDLTEHRLPNRILYPWAAVTAGMLLVVSVLLGDIPGLLRGIGAGLLWGVLFLIARLAHPPSIGMGDVKLAVVLGLYTGFLGWATVAAAVLLSFLLAGAVALVLLLTRQADRRTRLPFGPFLILGTAIAMIAA